MTKYILITGSKGYLGHYLVKELESKKYNIIKHSRNQFDLKNWDKLKNIKKNISIIYHLAASADPVASFENPRETLENNIISTLNMLELCKQKKIKKIIFISSYLNGTPKYLPIDEKHPLPETQINPYAQSKKICEDLCKFYSQLYNINCIILRIFNIYGGKQRPNLLISTIINQLDKKEIILKDSEPKRDYIHIKDVISACVKTLKYDETRFEIFHIGSGKSHSVKEIVNQILKISQKKIKVNYLNERRINEVMDCKADILKAKKLLKWTPKIDITEGLKEMIEKNE